MHALESTIESILFVESKPLTLRKLAHICNATEAEVDQAVQQLQQTYAERAGGVVIVREGNHVQCSTARENSGVVKAYLQEEYTGELTRPSLETLTIIAYRGPVAKSEIELIRGVNCSLILRNLMIRGLAEEVGETEAGSPLYRVTVDFLRFVGVTRVEELPNYVELNSNVNLQELLASKSAEGDFFKRQ